MRPHSLLLLSGATLLAVLVLDGCEATPPRSRSADDPSTDDRITLVDADGGQVALPARPDRILSLVPSVTRILVELGEGDRLVGRTDYDDLAAIRELPSVGGGLEPTMEIVASLEPEVVIRFAG